MTNIKTYVDGDRFIIVVEKPDGETASRLNNVLTYLAGCPTMSDKGDWQPRSIEGLVPKKVSKEPAPMLSSDPLNPYEMIGRPIKEPMSLEDALSTVIEGTNVTLRDAIEYFDTGSIVEMLVLTTRRDLIEEKTIVDECKKYIVKDCERRLSIENTSTLEIRRFYAMYSPLLLKSVREILDQVGYENMDDFFLNSDEFLHQNAYCSWLLFLIEELS